MSDLISRKAAIKELENLRDYYGFYNLTIYDAINKLKSLPPAQTETCEGCKHVDKYENEVEYGYPSPCACCKRRVEDYYER